MSRVRAMPAPWAVLALLGFLAALMAAWHILAPARFLYGVWYEPVGIAANIAEYGPRNRHRQGFAGTSREEHERLMGELVTAINHHGKGLEQIQYHDRNGAPIASLLTEAEIVHLRDVARLVGYANQVALWAAILLAVSTFWLYRRGVPMPSLRLLLLGMLALVAAFAALVMLLGPVKVFYQLHVWLFPSGNQWFFYYEDSLMTTMLKAPVIFGPIAAAMVGLALLLWWLLFALIGYWFQKRDAARL